MTAATPAGSRRTTVRPAKLIDSLTSSAVSCLASSA